MRALRPALVLRELAGVRVWTDVALADDAGVIVAFSERTGGVSQPPFGTLNLAAHVGDDPAAVDENRTRFLGALGLETVRSSLVVPDQVHGTRLIVVGPARAGSGAFATTGADPIAATDALLTCTARIPLMLCFADCVPVILVAPGPTVAVVHAGWRGALARLPGIAATRLSLASGAAVGEVAAYIGPHIHACHYAVGDEIISQFVNTCGTLARADSGGLDLEVAVTASLIDAGVAQCSIARLGMCTAEATDRFFSYRAQAGRTGRHAALACIL